MLVSGVVVKYKTIGDLKSRTFRLENSCTRISKFLVGRPICKPQQPENFFQEFHGRLILLLLPVNTSRWTS